MNVKKSLLVLGTVTGIGLAGVTGLGVASASTNSGSGDTIIDKVAAKFNLDKGEVRAVFAEEQAERQVEHKQKMEERLTAAVEQGELTEEQKTKISAKLEELHQRRETFRGTASDGQAHVTVKHDMHESLEQWAKDNNIPLKYLMHAHSAKVPEMQRGAPTSGVTEVEGVAIPANPANR